ncbi:MAG: ABC transporter permease [Actinomycetota bacterium]|nr:ABC transporter permease [Actinomycetota bacterium]MDQ2956222.1 ABC transporter permease [Actinomycetota bacterium]
MTRFLIRRVLGVLLVMLIVTAVTYALFFLLPADPARLSCGKPCTADRLAQVRSLLGYNRSVPMQYWEFLRGIVFGRSYGTGAAIVHCSAPCFGYSFPQGRDVTSLIADRFPVTLSIAIGAALLWLVAGVLAGIVAALYRGSWLDRLVTVGALGGVSAPTFLVGLLGILIFGFRLNVLPVNGYVAFTDDPVQWAFHLVLPWCTLAFVFAAIYARLTRTQLLDVLNEDYIALARAKGLSRRRVIGRHALRAALTPVLTLFALDLGGLLGGAVITEKVFGMQGLGALLIDAVGSSDLPVVVGCTIFAGFLIVLANLVVDLTYSLLDPRVIS